MKTEKKVSTGELFKKLFVASRPISWINTAYPFAAGYLAAGGAISIFFVLASLYFLIPYNVLIYVVNDVFDYESDKRNPRKNSIEGGLLEPGTHRFMLVATAFINLPFIMYICATGTLAQSGFFLLIVAGALSYSVPPMRLKERPVLDSMNSSFHFVSPLLFALIITSWQGSYWLYVGAFFLWGVASHAFGAVQDIKADRQAGIRSIATFFGARATVRLSLVMYLGATGSVVLAGWPAAIVALPILLYVWMVYPYVNLADTNCEQTNNGWRKFLLINQVTGFVITVLILQPKIG